MLFGVRFSLQTAYITAYEHKDSDYYLYNITEQ